jgi:L-threonylcarbamoyladenylate synthase
VNDVDGALSALEAGDACVIPTDTVYGVAASLNAPGAVDRLFELKGRPRDKPLPVLAADVAALESVVSFDAAARRLARRFWPGALTIVLPRAPWFDTDLGGDVSTVAVRIPRHDVTLTLLEKSGPLAVTSANRSGEPPVTIAAAASTELGADIYVLDGGTCDGEPSTIIDLTTMQVLRVGALEAASVLNELEP